MQGGRRRELARLWQVAVRRPRWQLWVAALVSLWTLCWIFGQLAAHASSPLDVLRGGLGWADVPTGWLDAVTDWLRADRRRPLLELLAVAGGLRRVVLMPRDVLHAGVTAATLSAVVPLLAPGFVLVRLCRPYVTRPPRASEMETAPPAGTALTNADPRGVVEP
jgi:hypothetical protein